MDGEASQVVIPAVCQIFFLLFIYHSSDEYEVSFAGLGFLALYLAGKLHLFDNRGHAVSPYFAESPTCVDHTLFRVKHGSLSLLLRLPHS
jgi:hypothetical protein